MATDQPKTRRHSILEATRQRLPGREERQTVLNGNPQTQKGRQQLAHTMTDQWTQTQRIGRQNRQQQSLQQKRCGPGLVDRLASGNPGHHNSAQKNDHKRNQVREHDRLNLQYSIAWPPGEVGGQQSKYHRKHSARERRPLRIIMVTRGITPTKARQDQARATFVRAGTRPK